MKSTQLKYLEENTIFTSIHLSLKYIHFHTSFLIEGDHRPYAAYWKLLYLFYRKDFRPLTLNGLLKKAIFFNDILTIAPISFFCFQDLDLLLANLEILFLDHQLDL